jgi:hypothetical protein
LESFWGNPNVELFNVESRTGPSVRAIWISFLAHHLSFLEACCSLKSERPRIHQKGLCFGVSESDDKLLLFSQSLLVDKLT